jgi:predicted Zn-dependent protease
MSDSEKQAHGQPSRDPIEPDLPSEFVEASPLLRQVFFERYFRAAAILMLLFLVFLGLFLPKIYTSTPEGVVPAYKMSGLDVVQAWSLARSARAMEATGNHNEALLAWRSAAQNNPGDPHYAEGLIRLVVNYPATRREFLAPAASYAFWHLQLTKTNDASLELAARLFAKYSLDDYAIGLLGARATNLTPALAGIYLKSLFHQSRMDQFGELWASYSNVLSNDREMQVVRAAWQSGWGPPGQISQGRQALEAARNDPATRDLAHRLSLPIAVSLSDTFAYERALAALVDNHADRVRDHVAYWRLLVVAGRSAKAAELARGFSRPPETPADAKDMVETLIPMGAQEYAAQFLEQHLPAFSFRPDLWELMGELLITLKQWPELRDLAVRMRQNQMLREDMAGYAWFLEGLSNLRTERREAALEAFTRAADFPTTNPLLSFKVARQLTTLGYPILATRLLSMVEKAYGNQAMYWFAVVGAAYEARQFDTMREAAARGYLLNTNEPIFISNYAAMLLMERTNASLASQLTLRALARRPTDIGMQINHAQALMLNGRLQEAEEALGKIKIDEVDSYLITERNLAYFELHAKLGDKAKALAAYRGIEARFLFLPQLRWLDQAYLQLTGEKRPAPTD